MVKDIVFNEGKNDFENNEFLSSKWSAPSITSPQIIKEYLDSFRLKGRRIEKIRLLGLAFDVSADYLAIYAADYSENNGWPDTLDEFHPNTPIPCRAEIDEPIQIMFEDGDTFEIQASMEPYYELSMNCIPWECSSDTLPPNVDGSILFSPCIGKTIREVEVITESDTHELYTYESVGENGDAGDVVKRIVLHLEDGSNLAVWGSFDFCDIACIGEDGYCLSIPFSVFRRGLLNYDILSEDYADLIDYYYNHLIPNKW